MALLGGIAGALIAPATASAELPHLVVPGETLWSISVANNLTTRTVAVFNGIPEDAHVIAGETIEVPTVEEGAAALASAGVTTTTGTTTSAPPVGADASYGLGAIYSPWGDLYLEPAAAASWNAMRQASLAQFGVDLYPDGPLSAYRTYEQQAYLYDLFLSGAGSPANPPGSSTHELGISVDVAEPVMREIVDQIGAGYGWAATIPDEWWHVAYLG